jgi:putative transposase
MTCASHPVCGAERAAGDQPGATPRVKDAHTIGALKGRQDSSMPQSLAKNLIHLVFSTKNRDPLLTEHIRTPLCEYASAVLRDLESHVIAIDAWNNHVHILFTLSRNHSLARVVMEVKRATSKWIKTQGRGFTKFHWQNGYGAFSIGQSGVEEVTKYISNQADHHRIRSFEEELRSFLKRYEIEFDERYAWD